MRTAYVESKFFLKLSQFFVFLFQVIFFCEEILAFIFYAWPFFGSLDPWNTVIIRFDLAATFVCVPASKELWPCFDCVKWVVKAMRVFIGNLKLKLWSTFPFLLCIFHIKCSFLEDSSEAWAHSLFSWLFWRWNSLTLPCWRVITRNLGQWKLPACRFISLVECANLQWLQWIHVSLGNLSSL